MESNLDGALRLEITNILAEVLRIQKPGDVALAEILPEAILREGQTCALTGLSRATLWRRVAAGAFPKPLKLGDARDGSAVGWLASEVVSWMRSLRREDGEEAEARNRQRVLELVPRNPAPAPKAVIGKPQERQRPERVEADATEIAE